MQFAHGEWSKGDQEATSESLALDLENKNAILQKTIRDRSRGKEL